jgi:hypothetical protein
MNASQLVEKFLEGSSPRSYLTPGDAAELVELLLACHDQGARNQVANWRTWQDERLNMHTEFTKPEFSVTWPGTDQQTLPGGDKQ